MAQLPPDGEWLVQLIDGKVVIFNRHSEEEIVAFDTSNPDEATNAQKIIHESDILTPEQKCYAHFWSGYFYRYGS